MKILFICKHNKFRSKVAESYFNKINKKISARSGGLILGKPIHEKTIQICEKEGIKLQGRPRGVSDSLLEKQDLIVIVADNVPPSLFSRYKDKLRVWEVKDADAFDEKEIADRIRVIKMKVEELVKELERK